MTELPERTTSAAKRLAFVTLLAGILVALLALLAPPASASPLLHPETRVAAIEQPTGQFVGLHSSVLAVQGRERAPSYDPTATGSSVAREGGPGGGGITAALGVNEYLDDFADAEGAQTWKDWANPSASFESEFRRVIGDPTTQVKFNLQGVDNPWSAVQRVASLSTDASVTDWELSEIYQNPEWWDRITFYNGAGNPVPSPFK
jgi:hypothetical protein